MSQNDSKSNSVNPFSSTLPHGADTFARLANPFLTPSIPAPAPAPAESVGYMLSSHGDNRELAAFEATGVETLSVRVSWSGNVLHVSNMTPAAPFTVGEGDEHNAVDYFIPESLLGLTRATLVAPRGDKILVTILPSARGYVMSAAGTKMSLDEVRAEGRAIVAIPGAFETSLALECRAHLEFGDIALDIGVETATHKLPAGFMSGIEKAPLIYGALSALVHVGVVSAIAFFMPALGGANAEDGDAERRELSKKLMSITATVETERVENQGGPGAPAGGEPGTKALGKEGKAGSPTSQSTNGRMAIAKKDEGELRISREQALNDASNFGMIGLVAMLNSQADPNAPKSPFGAMDTNGTDDANRMGNLFGDQIGEAHGNGGLGILGPGEGGGGKGLYIGLGDFGAFKNPGNGGKGPGGWGTCTVEPCGVGGTGHNATKPTLRTPNITSSGRLPPETIQRVIRASFGRFRACYESSLRSNPELKGNVTTAFTITRDGAVGGASSSGDLPPAVVACVAAGFRSLSFPAPEGGTVSVVYPINFTPN